MRIHVYLELAEPLCNAAGYLEILKWGNGTDIIVKTTLRLHAD